MSTACHPQTDGQTERVNATLEQYVRCYIDELKDNWAPLLSSAEFAYNNAAHEGTKNSPFFLKYGRHLRAGPTLLKDIQRTIDMDNIMWNRIQAQEQARAALQIAADRMKWYYDKYVQMVPFKEGDQVMLDLKDYQKSGQKLAPKYYGPFTIAEKLSSVTFRLEWPARLTHIHPVFHASKLVPYNEPQFAGQKYTMPAPDIIDGEEEFEVEKILESRRTGRQRKLQYYVRWKGYGRNDDSWEPYDNLGHAQDAIKEFYDSHPKAIRTITATTFCVPVDEQHCSVSVYVFHHH